MSQSSSLYNSARNIWHKSKIIRPAYWFCYRKVKFALHRNPIGKVYYRHRKDVTYGQYLPSFYNAHREEPIDEKKVIFFFFF